MVNPMEVIGRGKCAIDDDFPVEAVQAAVKEWKSVRPFLTGDIHLLLPLTVSYYDWCAWQLHREDMQAGVALIFRRHKEPVFRDGAVAEAY